MIRIFLALILTLSFLNSISNPSFASAAQSDTESAVNVAFSKVFECFDASLAKYTEGPLLPKPVGTDPIDLWMGLADALNKSANYSAHSPNWAEFAKRLVLMAQHGIKTEQQKTEYETYFQNEIEEFFAAGKTDYKWFVLFAQRLTALMTNPDERNERGANNTRYDGYIRDVCASTVNKLPSWLKHDNFVYVYKHIWSKFTREVLSLPEMLRECGNDIIFLPYPWDMDAIDIMRSIPTPNGNHLWPVGYASDKVMADMVLLNPMKFFQHDILHANVIILALRGAFCFYKIEDGYSMMPSEADWPYVKRNRQLFFDIVEIMQGLMKQVHDKEDTLTIAYFSFQWVHEKINSRMALLGKLLKGDLSHSPGAWYAFCNPNYYQPLLPIRLLELSKTIPQDILVKLAQADDEEIEVQNLELDAFKEQYLQSERLFLERLLATIREKKPNFMCTFELRDTIPIKLVKGSRNLYTAQNKEITEFGYEGFEREVPEDDPTAKLGQRVYLGSPFYLGEVPPSARVAYRSGLVDEFNECVL